MRKLNTEQRAAILSALVEGNSVNATARMCSVSKVTVLRLLADAGTLAAQWHDLMVRDLESKRVQVDEIWSFVHTKQKNVQPMNWGRVKCSPKTGRAVKVDSLPNRRRTHHGTDPTTV